MTKVFTTFDFEEVAKQRLAELDSAQLQSYLDFQKTVELRNGIAEMVYQARKSAGLTKTELAKLVGTSPKVLSAIENGLVIPRLTTLMRIAEALESPLEIRIGQAGFVHTPVAS